MAPKTRVSRVTAVHVLPRVNLEKFKKVSEQANKLQIDKIDKKCKKNKENSETTFAEPSGHYMPNLPFEARHKTPYERLVVTREMKKIADKMELRRLLKRREDILKELSNLSNN